MTFLASLGVKPVMASSNFLETFNLTYGKAHSINHMLEILSKSFKKVKITYSQKDKFTPNRGTLSVDKAREMLGYAPKYHLDLGYTKYINWYKQFWKNLEKTF